MTCYWHEGSFVAHPYPGGTPVAVHPVAAEILSAFDDWLEPAKAIELLDHLTPDTVGEAVDMLTAAGLLLTEDSPAAAVDGEVAQKWATWALEAAFFHYGSQLFPEDETETTETTETGDETVTALPPMFTSYPDAERVMLPRRPAGPPISGCPTTRCCTTASPTATGPAKRCPHRPSPH
jgi:hypothetical protein